jgi:2-polyprenyl-3-methyl-5-hydroxy-6-metoxy-1,4-benzoquinol methylase
LAKRSGLSSFTVLDIASGGGDVAIALAKHAAAASVQLEIVGCDISATAVKRANEAANATSAPIRFEQRDVFSDCPAQSFDIVMCSLFVHHLDGTQAVELLRIMSSLANRLLLVNDLRRCLRGYLLAQLACRMASRSRIVHVDGPRSVAGAFTRAELRDLCRQVPLAGAEVSGRWPCRLLLQWKCETPG